MKCLSCGCEVIFDYPERESKEHGYNGAWMCGCTTVLNEYGKKTAFPSYWVEGD